MGKIKDEVFCLAIIKADEEFYSKFDVIWLADNLGGFIDAFLTKNFEERNMSIWRTKLVYGKTYKEVGAEYGMTACRARQICEHLSYMFRDMVTKANVEGFNFKVDNVNSIPIQALQLSDRCRHALTDIGLKTLGDVKQFIDEYGDNWYKKVRGIGVKTRFEVEDYVKEKT